MPTQLEPFRGAVAERYQVLEELGAGGMAVVYLGLDVRHDRRVAIKILRPELATVVGAERFLREIKIAAKLSHPHILPLLDSGQAAGLLYYVMPFVEGESLRERIRREKQLPLTESLAIAKAIAGALSHAHSQGIVHRDVKPENVLLQGGHPVLADFGIARALDAADPDALTATGLAIGTPCYMSPEQAADAGSVDARADVYALGCVFYEMLAGDPPFVGSTPGAILARKAAESPPSLRTVRETVPVAVEDLIRQALARIPADRIQTAFRFAELLDNAATPDPHQAGRPKALPARSLRHRLQMRLLVLAAIVASVALGLVLVPSSDEPGGPGGENLASLADHPPGELRILATEPLAGTILTRADLSDGVQVRVTLSHAIRERVDSTDVGSPVVYLMVRIGEGDEHGDDWRVLASRTGTLEPRHLALTGQLRASDVIDGRITLRAALAFTDSSGAVRVGYDASSLVEYTVVDSLDTAQPNTR